MKGRGKVKERIEGGKWRFKVKKVSKGSEMQSRIVGRKEGRRKGEKEGSEVKLVK